MSTPLDQWERNADVGVGVGGEQPAQKVNRQDWREVVSAYMSLLRANLFPTLVYCTVYLSFGISVAYLGPTVDDLQCLIHATGRQISLTFFAQILFTLIGTLVSGVLASRYPPNMMLLLATGLLSACTSAVPFCLGTWSLVLLLCLMGLNMGAMDNLSNIAMLKLYGSYSAPFLQLMYFCYGLGALLSSLVAMPFLSDVRCGGLLNTSARAPPAAGVAARAATQQRTEFFSEVQYAYWIFSGVQLPVPLLVGILAFKYGEVLPSDSTSAAAACELKGPAASTAGASMFDRARESARRKARELREMILTDNPYCALTIVLGAVLTLLFDGLQASFSDYVFKFASKNRWFRGERSVSAELNAAFWGMFAAGRLVSVFLAVRLTPAFMMLCGALGSLAAITFIWLTLWAGRWALFIGSAMFGLFLSNATPSVVALCEQHLTLNQASTTLIIVSATAGEMLFPLLVGNVMVSFGHRQFLTFHLVLCAVTALTIGAFWRFSKGTPKGQLQQSFVWAELSMNRISELDADERVLQPAAAASAAGFTPGVPPPYSAACASASNAFGAYSERLPLATATDTTLRRLYSAQEEESARSSAFQSRVQSASPSQHNLATGAASSQGASTAIPMSAPGAGRTGNGALHDRPSTNPFK